MSAAATADETLTDIQRAARELAERTAREQGLPLHVEDPVALARVVAILRAQ